MTKNRIITVQDVTAAVPTYGGTYAYREIAFAFEFASAISQEGVSQAVCFKV